MSRVLVRQQSSVKGPKKSFGIEFRWSVSAYQPPVSGKSSVPRFPRVNHRITPITPISSVQSSRTNRSSFPNKRSPPSSPRLPIIQHVHQPAPTNKTRSTCPLSLTYSQLFHAQHPSPKKKAPVAKISIYSFAKRKPTRLAAANRNVTSSSESTDQQQSLSEQYIRLRSPQLRRLQVSEKNIKEAKKLYFNADCKVFVPYASIIEAS